MSSDTAFDQTKLIDMYERLFAESGWKELIEDCSQKREQVKETLVSNSRMTEKELFVAQGQVSVWDYIISLERTIEQVKAQAASEPELPDLIDAN